MAKPTLGILFEIHPPAKPCADCKGTGKIALLNKVIDCPCGGITARVCNVEIQMIPGEHFDRIAWAAANGISGTLQIPSGRSPSSRSQAVLAVRSALAGLEEGLKRLRIM